MRFASGHHNLPYFDDEVHFPDVRIEYQEPDGRWEREDIEVLTPHYRGAHAASVGRSGFSCYRGISLSVSGRSGVAKGRGRHGEPRAAVSRARARSLCRDRRGLEPISPPSARVPYG